MPCFESFHVLFLHFQSFLVFFRSFENSFNFMRLESHALQKFTHFASSVFVDIFAIRQQNYHIQCIKCHCQCKIRICVACARLLARSFAHIAFHTKYPIYIEFDSIGFGGAYVIVEWNWNYAKHKIWTQPSNFIVNRIIRGCCCRCRRQTNAHFAMKLRWKVFPKIHVCIITL